MTDDPRMILWLLMVLLFSLGTHWIVGVRLVGPWSAGLGHKIAWGLLALDTVLLPLTFLAMPFSGRPWADLLQWVGYIFAGFFSLVFAFWMLRDGVWWLLVGLERVAPEASPLPADPERRRVLELGLNLGIGALSAVVGSAALVVAQRGAEVVRIRLPIRDLPAPLEGFRIAQISDIHVGPTVRAGDLESVVERVNALDADLVAVTGDLVDGPVPALAPHVAPLAGLRSRHGTFFVTGNHEYYSGAEVWCEHLRQLGMDVLTDEHRLLDHDGAGVLVAGVPDRFASSFVKSHVCDPAKALAGGEAAPLRILLAHQPESADRASELGFHLQLSGHTHGGQYFPFTWLIHLGKRFVAGLHRVGELWLYVNRGLTWWGPPMRLGSAQEITLVELTSDPTVQPG
jgi:predicted MPP superfamily phosphohydrolase